MEAYLPTLVPKLYRYKHDPNARTRQAMTHIWVSLHLDKYAEHARIWCLYIGHVCELVGLMMKGHQTRERRNLRWSCT